MMNKKDWWIDFFKGDFSNVVLTQDAQPAFEFITDVCRLQSDSLIYDQCCGKGTLALKLAETGCQIIGVDASEEYIIAARKGIKSDNINFILADARYYINPQKFDLIINWHTSLGYEKEDDQNIKMIEAIAQNLKKNGQFIISTMNPNYVRKYFQKFIVKEIPYEQSSIITIRKSDIVGDILSSEWTIIYPDGQRLYSYGQTKLYNLKDFDRMFKKCGLKILNVYGDVDKSRLNNNRESLIIHGIK